MNINFIPIKMNDTSKCTHIQKHDFYHNILTKHLWRFYRETGEVWTFGYPDNFLHFGRKFLSRFVVAPCNLVEWFQFQSRQRCVEAIVAGIGRYSWNGGWRNQRNSYFRVVSYEKWRFPDGSWTKRVAAIERDRLTKHSISTGRCVSCTLT